LGEIGGDLMGEVGELKDGWKEGVSLTFEKIFAGYFVYQVRRLYI
jgi:hypothetical protein